MKILLLVLIIQILLAFRKEKTLSTFLLANSLPFIVITVLVLNAQIILIDGILLLYSSLLFIIINNYSFYYFESDNNHYQVFVGYAFLQLFVFYVITASSIISLWSGFIGISLSLLYLISYNIQHKSLKTIKQSFIISDVLLTSSLVILFFYNQSLDIFLINEGNIFVTILLLISIMIKSALFPFNNWLEKSIITPAPISAVMHAGVINLGLLLVYKFYPILFANNLMLTFFIIITLISSIFGKSMLLTQIDEKRKLIFSTSGQLSYMYLQAALGFFVGAFYHLMLHGMIKSNLFLSQSSHYNYKSDLYKTTYLQDMLIITTSIILAFVVSIYTNINLLILFFISFSTITFIQDSYRIGSLIHSIFASLIIIILSIVYVLATNMLSINLLNFRHFISLPVTLTIIASYAFCYLFRMFIAEWLLVNRPYFLLKLHMGKCLVKQRFRNQSSIFKKQEYIYE